MAEHLTVDQVVAGSTPVRHPTKYGRFREKSLFLSICGGYYSNLLDCLNGLGAVVVQFGADQLLLA
jgi:hypothetical protein